MTCKKCGANVEEANSFCGECGAPTNTNETIDTNETNTKNNKDITNKVNKELATNFISNLKSKNPKSIGILVAAVAILLIIVAAINQPKKINLEDFVEISYYGYDEYASARAYIDEEALYYEMMNAAGLNEADLEFASNQDMYNSMLHDYYKLASAFNSIKLDVSPDENLSNGDKVTAEISYDNDFIKDFKINSQVKKYQKRLKA